jgi:hypothetical protein
MVTRHPFPSLEQRFGAALPRMVFEDRNIPVRNEKGEKVRRRPLGPMGTRAHKYDVWIPHPKECRPCCTVMAVPYANRPWQYYRHCCTIKHIAALFYLDETEFRRTLRRDRHQTRCSNCSKFRQSDDYLCGGCRKAIDSLSPKE